MKGKLIVIEGTDCSGKETQTSLLVQRLQKNGQKVERFSFPNYDSPTGMIVGGPYLGKNEISDCWFPEGSVNVDPYVAALYYAADRKYNIKHINELLDDGVDVILDRYVESNMAHQGCKIQDKNERLKLYKWLDTLEYGLLELPKPDLTIFLHMPYKKVLELKKGRIGTDQHESSLVHLKTSEEAYLELADLMHQYIVNCAPNNKLRDILDIQEEIYKIVKNFEK